MHSHSLHCESKPAAGKSLVLPRVLPRISFILTQRTLSQRWLAMSDPAALNPGDPAGNTDCTANPPPFTVEQLAWIDRLIVARRDVRDRDMVETRQWPPSDAQDPLPPASSPSGQMW